MDTLLVANGLTLETTRVLVYLFKTEARGDREVRVMVRKLAMERNVLQYHVERLKAAGLVDIESGKYLYGPVHWAVTAEGRRHVVEGKLL